MLASLQGAVRSAVTGVELSGSFARFLSHKHTVALLRYVVAPHGARAGARHGHAVGA